MARSIVDDLSHHLIRAFPADQAYVRDDFRRPPMPAPVATYLDRLLQRRLDYEAQRMYDGQTEWVDHDHEAVQAARRQLRKTIKAHGRIPQSEWENALRGAVQRVTAHLIQPIKSLSNFVFGSHDDTLPVHVVKRRMRFFAPYGYLREAVDTYAQEEARSSISRERFTALLTRVDHDRAATYEADDWMELLEPLFDLVDTLDAEQGVPVSFLHMFFAGKEAEHIAERLQDVSVEAGTTALDRDDVRELLDAPTPSETLTQQIVDLPDPLAPPPDDNERYAEPETSPAEAPPATGDAAPSEAPADERTTPPSDASSSNQPAPGQPAPAASGANREPPPPPEAAPPPDAATDESDDAASQADADEHKTDEQNTNEGHEDEGPTAAEATDEKTVDDGDSDERDKVDGDVEEKQTAEKNINEHDAAAPPSSDSASGTPATSDEAPDEEDEPKPLWQRFQRNNSSASSSSSPSSPPASTQPERSSESPSGPLWRRFQPTEHEAVTDDELTPLERDVLGAEGRGKRELFVRELFGGSRTDYQHVLERLREAPDWSRASQIIAEDVFRKHKVNIYSEPAVAFTDAVEAQYQE